MGVAHGTTRVNKGLVYEVLSKYFRRLRSKVRLMYGGPYMSEMHVFIKFDHIM
jgi:hypothetical protein